MDWKAEIWLEAASPQKASPQRFADVINRYYTRKRLPDQMTSPGLHTVQQVSWLLDTSDLSFDSASYKYLEREQEMQYQSNLTAEPFALKALRADHTLWATPSWSMVSRPGLTPASPVDPSQIPTPRPHDRQMNSRSWRVEPTLQCIILKLPRWF